ncbi:MAG: metabolite traffic protein EboE [Phycisphaerae bacterium]|jgi:sugar phosphate isomerase/epimerase|nr:metabolite traffic protein EboE [Phycisphaerae bacterium]
MNISQTPPLHLTYCLNVHPGQTWADNFAAVRNEALRVRDIVCDINTPFGLGMRLGKIAADELSDADKLTEFREFLDANNLYVFTINGFPYGEFHDPGVKENVYAPDWRTDERRDYTILLADILADLLPEGVSGSISTVPGSYKPWIKTPADVEAMVDNLADVAAHLYQLRRARGVSICVALEPEPDCFIETSEEVVRFFTGPLREYGKARVREKLNISGHKAAKLLRRHIGVCLDTAHAAVEFEDPAQAAQTIRNENIRIAKVQMSSALNVTIPTAADQDLRRKIEEFCDPVYLHQTRIRRRDLVNHHDDLPDALSGGELRPGDQWRVHFHVPLFFGEFEGLEGTNDLLTGRFAELLIGGLTEHLEIETYTFGVLPDNLRPDDLPPAIAKEYRWVMDNCLGME